jgi:large subunit ribosomal protein L17
MRHRKRRGKLSMKTSHRDAMLRSMVRNLLRHQRIETTLARAKETRRLAEQVITLARADTVAARRRAYAVLTDRDMVAKLFKDIVPLFKERRSGYTRIIPLGSRRGDGAQLAILELTEKKIEEKLPKKRKKKVESEGAPKKEAPQPAAEAEAKPKEAKKEEPKKKAPPKAKPTLEEEKRTEKAKSEEKKIEAKKSFMKNLRGFFRRKTDM